jgi:hypothetical protein
MDLPYRQWSARPAAGILAGQKRAFRPAAADLGRNPLLHAAFGCGSGNRLVKRSLTLD